MTQPNAADCEALWRYLRANHGGAQRAVKERELAERAGLSPRQLQRQLEYLILTEGKPIASSCKRPMGVFVAVTRAEKEAYARQLTNRIIGLARRRKAFSDAPLDESLRQAGLWESPK